MRLFLVYDPAVVTDHDALATSLGNGFTDVIAKTPGVLEEVTLPAAGYSVIVNTWQGWTAHPGPLTPTDVSGYTEPVNPTETARIAKEAVRSAISASGVTVDAATVTAALARLDAIIATGSVAALGASPTNADVVAQVRTLTSAINIAADAIRDLARIEKGIIHFLT
jgi:hypothetical protein